MSAPQRGKRFYCDDCGTVVVLFDYAEWGPRQCRALVLDAENGGIKRCGGDLSEDDTGRQS